MRAIASYAKDAGEEIHDSDAWELGKPLSNMLKHETLNAFLSSRSASQGMQITTD